MNKKSFTMPQLEKELRKKGFKDASARKVRYFIDNKLLKGPKKKGGGARYDEDYLLRILAIHKMWKRYRVSEIKQKLKGMAKDDIRKYALCPDEGPALMTREETDYKLRHGIPRQLVPSSPPIIQQSSMENLDDRSLSPAQTTLEIDPQTIENTWRRISLLDGIELFVRNDSLQRLRKNAPFMVDEIQSILERLSGQGDPYMPSPRPSSISGSSSQQLECYRLNGHLFAEIGEHRALIDTGFPRSFGNCGTLSICGREFKVPQELNFPTAVYSTAEFSKLIEVNFSVFLGTDVLKEFDFLIDLKEGKISFGTKLEKIRGERIDLHIKESLPVVSVDIEGTPFPFLIATGNKLSSLHSSIGQNYAVVGKDTEFLPRMWEFHGGKFETELRRVKFRIGGKNYALAFGQFPQVQEDFFRVGLGVMGSLGADFLEKRSVGFSLKRKMLFL